MKIIFSTSRRYHPRIPIRLAAVLLLLPLVPAIAHAQDSGSQTAAVATQTNKPKPIQDNSFMVEEAYNQEFGVVQHINSFVRDFNSHSWVYTFTQEWPVPGVKHQLSYSLSAVRNTDYRGGAGLGDAAINYRYQMVGDGDARLAFAPRATLLIPSGSPSAGRGFGGTGFQTDLPLSVVINDHLVTHWNAGATFVPHARNELGDHAATYGYNLGQSIVWLARPRFNLLLETTWAGAGGVVGPGRTQRVHDLLISPGVRWAYNFKNGLQIVPGIGVPMGVGPSAGEKGVFLYLSFEHPFRSIPKQ